MLINLSSRPELERFSSSLRSCGLAHISPCDRVLGTEICDAIDRVIAALKQAGSNHSRGGFEVHLDDFDLLVASAALPHQHWLRDTLRRLGASLHAPRISVH